MVAKIRLSKIFRASGINIFRLSLLIIVSLFLILNVRPVFAFTQTDVDAIYGDSTFYDPASAGASSCGSNSTTPASAGAVYFVGDSIGTQVQDGLGPALQGKQFKADAQAGRTLSNDQNINGVSVLSGLSAVDQDQDYIKTAATVVVELGTNSGGFSVETVGQMVSKIHSLSPNATIYWVDTAVVQRQDYAKTLDGVNSIIYSQAAAQNFQVISWNKAVFGDSADPKNINPDAPDNSYIRRSDEYVHLTDQGIKAMTDLIASAINGGSANGTAACGCTLLAGNSNPEKVWNYFIGKGLSAFQVAAIMGNLQAESGFDPKRVEGGWGLPAESDTITPNLGKQGQPGYGIAQWTSPSRKLGLVNKAASEGKPIYDLGVQLDFMWDEFQGPSYQGMFNQLKQSTDIKTANSIFGNDYEGFGTNTEGTRLGFANDWLLKFGSGSSSSSSSGSGGSSC